MASKLVAVFLMFVVVLAAIHLCKAEANDDEFNECFDKRWKGPAVTLSVR